MTPRIYDCASWGMTSGGAARDLLVLWDIDGTLLNAGGVGARPVRVVFLQLFGRSLDDVRADGRAHRPRDHPGDAHAGGGGRAAAVRRPVHRGPGRAGAVVRSSVAARGRALPGAAAALRGAASGHAHQSVLTGNIRPVAEVKLARARAARRARPVHRGLRRRPRGPGRAGAGGAAARRRRARRSGVAGFGGLATVVIGDTPLDIAAALAAGARAVGVATGAVFGRRAGRGRRGRGAARPVGHAAGGGDAAAGGYAALGFGCVARQAGEHGLGWPVQPRLASERATCAAVRQAVRVMSSQS